MPAEWPSQSHGFTSHFQNTDIAAADLGQMALLWEKGPFKGTQQRG